MLVLTSKKSLVSYIYTQFSQIALFSFYLKIRVDTIEYCLGNKKRKIRNPIRPSDDTPSLGFLFFKSKYGPKLRMRDWGDSRYNFDIIDLVGYLINKDSSKTNDFLFICEHIIKTFDPASVLAQDASSYSEYIPEVEGINVFTRDFTLKDISFWDRRGLNVSDLQAEGIYAVETAFSGETCIYNYKYSDPCYAYFDSVAGDIQYWELYFPNRNKKGKLPRHYTNINYHLKDLRFIRSTKYLLITKGKKEAALIRSLFKNPPIDVPVDLYNLISVIRFSSESVMLDESSAKALNERFEVYINTDGDRQGVVCARYHSVRYGFKPLLFSNGFLGSRNYKVKDLDEFCIKYGRINTFLLILEVLTILGIYDFTDYQTGT